MDFVYYLLALIQAVLEWLPVSSEGFITLTAVNGFHMDPMDAIRIAIYFHLGTGLAVLVKYWRQYWNALVKDYDVLRFLIISTMATGIVGIPLYLLLDTIFENSSSGLIFTLLIGITLLITATLLRFGRLKNSETYEMKDRKILDEILLGACQGIAILPGISRSGTTVTYLVLRGYKKEDAFNMSFLISLPAVIGAIGFDLVKHLLDNTSGAGIGIGIEWWNYVLLTLFTAIIGYAFMTLLLKVARKWRFDLICYALGGLTVLLITILLILS
ncbi:MAG: undecaprenyl-diphosphate phosphatase [Promethearchaeota archaeon]